MPLDAKNGQGGVYNGLCHAVRGVLDDDQAFAWLRNALMMGAVDREVFSIQGVEKASLFRIRGVDLIFSDVCMPSGGGQILNDAASQADIDQLHAFADAEYGKIFSQKRAKEEKLKPVQFGIHGTGSLIFLMKKSRVNVAAPRKNESIERGSRIRKKSGERFRRIDGEPFWQCIGQRPADGAQSREGRKIVLNLAGRAGNQKMGSGHFVSFFRFGSYCYLMPEICL